MKPERFKRIQEIFVAAAGMAAGERAAFLAQRCGDDEELRQEVESLLSADADAGTFMEDPAALAAGLDANEALEGVRPQRTGAYKLLHKIGEGGMSEVYLAVRADDEYQKRVALKIIRQDLGRKDLIQRFKTERQILAGLDHPNIARLLDGGTTDAGLPYFVMEYIEGSPIDQYCDDRRLTIRERLDLFRTVCSAVQYAHQNLIIHRDIKAGNILVDAQGQPKLLDFGIAKLLKPDQFAANVEYTATWMRLMTPRYASPEQIQGKPVSTASDVYSLGVLLYKLLTGHMPHRFDGTDPSAMGRQVVEENPQRPSTSIARVETDPGRRDKPGTEITPETVSKERDTQPGHLRRRLAGDLDNILLMALRKEPQRRYGSVEQFSDDIRRHLVGLPVLARPDTLSYRTTKFLARNRWPVAGLAAFMLLLMAFAGTMAFQAQRIGEERDQARRERDRAENAIDFLEGIFAISDPFSPAGDSITAREVLERGAEKVESELADQPETRAALQNSIGRVYSGLGLFQESEPLLRQALSTRIQHLQADDPQIAESHESLANLLRLRGDLEDAERHARQAQAENEKIFGKDHVAVARSLVSVALIVQDQGHFDEAASLYERAIGIHAATATDELERARLLLDYGSLLNEMGQEEEAGAGFREALSIRRRVLGEEHALVAEALNDLGVFNGIRGNFEASEELLRSSLAMRTRLLGPDHHRVAEGMNNLGTLLKNVGELAEAEQLYRDALVILRHRLGDQHPRVGIQVYNIARLLHAKDDLAGAEKLFQESLAIRRQVLGNSHSLTGFSLSGLGAVLLDQGRPPEAQVALGEAMEIFTAALPPDHWRTAEARSLLGQSLAETGRDEEAETLLVEGYRAILAARGSDHPRTKEALARVTEFYDSRSRSTDLQRLAPPPAD